MKKIQAVIFDYGNVLCEPQRPTDVVNMSNVSGIPLSAFERSYWEFRDAYDKGSHSARAYWNAIGTNAGLEFSEKQLDELIDLDNRSWTRPSPPVAEWATNLRAHGVRTAILSNMPLELRKYIGRSCEWLPVFDHQVYSCDVNSIKPESEIYIHCMKLLRVAPDDALFIDDREPNVSAARQLGIHALVFSDLEKVSRELSEQFDLPVPLAHTNKAGIG